MAEAGEKSGVGKPRTANDLPEEFAFGFLGNYQLVHQIGAGGVARVYRARHAHPQYAERPCAVKILHEEIARSPEISQFFRDEAYLLAQLDHPHIVRTYEAGIEGGRPYIAMEYIDGRDLGVVLHRLRESNARLPVSLALYITICILRALEYAHEASDADGNPLELVHRDVNPYNVFLSFDGRVKLGDFGTALLGQRGVTIKSLCGKIGYFAPEQIAEGKTDPRSDIFAVGIVLYELLCGRHPLGDVTIPDALAVNRRFKYQKPRKLEPAIDSELEKIIVKALARKPGRRFSNAKEMLAALWPLVASLSGMKLAVAATMRGLFVGEHAWELKLRAGLTGKDPLAGRQPMVSVVGADAERKAKLAQLAGQVGFRVVHHQSLRDIAPANDGTVAVLVSLCADRDFATALLADYEHCDLPVPLVAVAERLDTDELRLAHELHAMDLLYGQISAQRLHTALVNSLDRQTPPEDQEEEARVSVLMLSRDPELPRRLMTHLSRCGYDLTTVDGPASAVDQMTRRTFLAAIIDCDPAGFRGVVELADGLRRAPGIGLLPVLFLADDNQEEALSGVTRSDIVAREAPMASVLGALKNLRREVPQSRTFVRYQIELDAELIFGGSHLRGKVSDISRGGLAVTLSSVPRMGTRIRIVLKLQGRSISLGGRVARVNRPSGGGPAIFGVELSEMSATDEAAYVSLICELAKGQYGR